MSRPGGAVSPRVKRALLTLSSLVLCLPLAATELDPKVDRAVRASLPVCDGLKLTYEPYPGKLGTGFNAAVVKIESNQPSCQGQLVAVTSPTGGFFLGMPWMIENEEGKTIEEKLRNFTWRNLQESMSVTVDRSKLSDDGLVQVTLGQISEAGTTPVTGYADPQGRVFYFGSFRRLNGDIPAQRAKAFDPFVAGSPSKGPAGAKVTIIEFSDFQCPACKRTSAFADAVVAEHGDAVRYVRFDLPLAGHAWAFPAALAGRAIHRQNPELFWQYKKEVYERQSDLNAFMFWDWARGWAEDHDLDMTKYDADLNSADLKKQILEGAGTAFSNDVRATPTFMVNGSMVDPGADGKGLAAHVAALLAKE